MIYCEASFVVSLITQEVHTADSRAWLRRQTGRQLAASSWVAVEVASALAMKFRRGVLNSEDRRSRLNRWQTLSSRSFKMLAVDERHFQRAATLVDAGRSGLRGGDSLHLAIVLDHGCALATYDEHLADAARAHGVEVHGIQARH